MCKKILIVIGLMMAMGLPRLDRADAESLYQLDEFRHFQEQGRNYFNAARKLSNAQEEGHLRIEKAIDAVRQSQTENEMHYWKMDYIQQRVWLVKAQCQICIDLLHQQEHLLKERKAAVIARNRLAQSDFYRGALNLLRIQRKLTNDRLTTLEDDLMAVTMLLLGSPGNDIDMSPWQQKRKSLLERLKIMRNELVYLAKNLDRIDIRGGDHATAQ